MQVCQSTRRYLCERRPRCRRRLSAGQTTM
ncbi:hypothetical protein KSF78_0009717 [Schistosoma japonicum]|nr:hypothetical protein KSF78_0009717 [Schistosoma japonicum]